MPSDRGLIRAQYMEMRKKSVGPIFFKFRLNKNMGRGFSFFKITALFSGTPYGSQGFSKSYIFSASFDTKLDSIGLLVFFL